MTRINAENAVRRLALILSLSAAAFAGAAYAQQGYSPEIGVTPGALLQSKAANYGPRELEYLTKELTRDVAHAVSRSAAPPRRIDLVIEDAQPNRPTFAQLGRSIGMSLSSVGIGGAQISGTITEADGSVRPIRYQYYEDDLRQERAASTWSDAERVFDMVSGQIASGRLSIAYRGQGPQSRGGEFGYPYDH